VDLALLLGWSGLSYYHSKDLRRTLLMLIAHLLLESTRNMHSESMVTLAGTFFGIKLVHMYERYEQFEPREALLTR
jgi:hypothetical protein